MQLKYLFNYQSDLDRLYPIESSYPIDKFYPNTMDILYPPHLC